MKVLFVCLGNICRSPMAEGIFNTKVQRLGLSQRFQSDSCGTGAYHIGGQPDDRTLAMATAHQVDISHIGRQLQVSDFDEFDLILAMDAENLREIKRKAKPHHYSKIQLMREYDPAGTGDVPDPYNGSTKDFQRVFQILDRSIDQLLYMITAD